MAIWLVVLLCVISGISGFISCSLLTVGRCGECAEKKLRDARDEDNYVRNR